MLITDTQYRKSEAKCFLWVIHSGANERITFELGNRKKNHLHRSNNNNHGVNNKWEQKSGCSFYFIWLFKALPAAAVAAQLANCCSHNYRFFVAFFIRCTLILFFAFSCCANRDCASAMHITFLHWFAAAYRLPVKQPGQFRAFIVKMVRHLLGNFTLLCPVQTIYFCASQFFSLMFIWWILVFSVPRAFCNADAMLMLMMIWFMNARHSHCWAMLYDQRSIGLMCRQPSNKHLFCVSVVHSNMNIIRVFRVKCSALCMHAGVSIFVKWSCTCDDATYS